MGLSMALRIPAAPFSCGQFEFLAGSSTELNAKGAGKC